MPAVKERTLSSSSNLATMRAVVDHKSATRGAFALTPPDATLSLGPISPVRWSPPVLVVPPLYTTHCDRVRHSSPFNQNGGSWPFSLSSGLFSVPDPHVSGVRCSVPYPTRPIAKPQNLE